MKKNSIINVLVLLITMVALVATAAGVFANEGAGVYTYTSIRGQEVLIYGKGYLRTLCLYSRFKTFENMEEHS